MREIKFRAWGGKQMHENVVIIDGTAYKRGYFATFLQDEAKAGISMQYTGLKDKNGKEIYEGDILRVTHEDGDSKIYQVRYMVEDYDYPAFDLVPHLDCDSNGLSHATAVCDVEVIGNIYETPELLQQPTG